MSQLRHREVNYLLRMTQPVGQSQEILKVCPLSNALSLQFPFPSPFLSYSVLTFKDLYILITFLPIYRAVVKNWSNTKKLKKEIKIIPVIIFGIFNCFLCFYVCEREKETETEILYNAKKFSFRKAEPFCTLISTKYECPIIWLVPFLLRALLHSLFMRCDSFSLINCISEVFYLSGFFSHNQV